MLLYELIKCIVLELQGRTIWAHGGWVLNVAKSIFLRLHELGKRYMMQAVNPVSFILGDATASACVLS